MRTTRYHNKTDQELRRLVAEATGWRVLHITIRAIDKVFYYLAGPDEVEPVPPEAIYKSKSNEDAAWKFCAYPNFSTDLNAIYNIVKDSGCQWNLWNDYKEFHCSIDIFRSDDQFPVGAVKVEEDTPARAMCVAWLLWNDQEENQ